MTARDPFAGTPRRAGRGPSAAVRQAFAPVLAALVALSLSAGALGEGRRTGSPPAAAPGGPPRPLFPETLGPVAEQRVPDGLATLSAQTCNPCHPAVHDEWAGSGHARAFTREPWRDAVRKAGSPVQCLHCHTPLVNQQRDLVTSYDGGDPNRPRLAPNPRFDPTLQAEGVTCAACHVRDGVVYGTRRLDPGEAPHPTEAHPDLQTGRVCASCHQLSWPGTEGAPFYDTWGEWEASGYARAGVGCRDCHMPWTSGVLSGTRHAAWASHRFPGGSDDATLRRSLTLLVNTDKPAYPPGAEVSASIELLGTGAGHAVPTSDPYHQVDVRARVETEGGVVLHQERWTLGREMGATPPYAERSDTRLHPGERRAFGLKLRLPDRIPGGGDPRLVVELVYRSTPPDPARRDATDGGRVFTRQVVEIAVR